MDGIAFNRDTTETYQGCEKVSNWDLTDRWSSLPNFAENGLDTRFRTAKPFLPLQIPSSNAPAVKLWS